MGLFEERINESLELQAWRTGTAIFGNKAKSTAKVEPFMQYKYQAYLKKKTESGHDYRVFVDGKERYVIDLVQIKYKNGLFTKKTFRYSLLDVNGVTIGYIKKTNDGKGIRIIYGGEDLGMILPSRKIEKWNILFNGWTMIGAFLSDTFNIVQDETSLIRSEHKIGINEYVLHYNYRQHEKMALLLFMAYSYPRVSDMVDEDVR